MALAHILCWLPLFFFQQNVRRLYISCVYKVRLEKSSFVIWRSVVVSECDTQLHLRQCHSDILVSRFARFILKSPLCTTSLFVLGHDNWCRWHFICILLNLILCLLGCGSGKYLTLNKSNVTLGSDYSSKLVSLAKHHGNEVMTCDNLQLPYRDSSFDAVISIGVIHHFTTSSRRVRAVQELARVLRPGGKLMIYVWALEQKQRQVCFGCVTSILLTVYSLHCLA